MNDASINTRNKLSRLAFFATQPHDCSYFEQRQAVTLFVDPEADKTIEDYSLLSHYGFRRSGNHIYRPHCHQCHACVAIRVPVKEFRPNRNQRRNLKLNRDLSFQAVDASYREEHFELYKSYLQQRHLDGGMDDTSPAQYREFMFSNWADTQLYEVRLQEQLLAIAVVDHMKNALSAVYTFYHPGFTRRSLGRFAVLCEIELARQLDLDYLYLGYWIRNCRKMLYKDEFQPLEYFQNGVWVTDKPSE